MIFSTTKATSSEDIRFARLLPLRIRHGCLQVHKELQFLLSYFKRDFVKFVRVSRLNQAYMNIEGASSIRKASDKDSNAYLEALYID